ncbi:MAG: hypothetical protein GY862_24340 [Gammaproteobacteria bacterium]|nr:hypothetical protein [Gammaproteobacteria bacterium]
MMKQLFSLSVKYLFGIGCLLSGLLGCSPSSEALKPVVAQNQQNINALVANTTLLMNLYEPLFIASGKSIVHLRIGKVIQEMTAVVGSSRSPAPASDQTWEIMFKKSAESFMGKKEKYWERFQFVQNTASRGPAFTAGDIEKLKQSEGWIYTAATNRGFTPQTAHQMLKELKQLKRDYANRPSDYYSQAETFLTPYDPLLASYKNSILDAQRLLQGLKYELSSQIDTVTKHSQAFTDFAGGEVNVQQTLSGALKSQPMMTLLNSLGNKYIKNPQRREASINLLTDGLNAAISMR